MSEKRRSNGLPEDISESGMMMGAMVMAKPSLAGGLPGAMAPPEDMTAKAMGGLLGANASSGSMKGMTGVVSGMGKAEMGKAMAGMTGMEAGTMDKLGMPESSSNRNDTRHGS